MASHAKRLQNAKDAYLAAVNEFEKVERLTGTPQYKKLKAKTNAALTHYGMMQKEAKAAGPNHPNHTSKRNSNRTRHGVSLPSEPNRNRRNNATKNTSRARTPPKANRTTTSRARPPVRQTNTRNSRIVSSRVIKDIYSEFG